MAKYRPLYADFWDDPDFEGISKDGKLLYLFLFSNRKTTESGIYDISKKFMSERTGIEVKKIDVVLQELKEKITFDIDKNIIFVHGFLKRNFSGRPELLLKSIENDTKKYPSCICWAKFSKIYSYHLILKDLINRLPTLCQGFNSNSNSNSNSNNNNNNTSTLGDQPEPKTESATWRTDFKIYAQECNDSFDALMADWQWIDEQKGYYPGVNIRKSLEKMYFQYWGTEAGWKKKKAAKTAEIDWKRTIENGLSMTINKVYFGKGEEDLERIWVEKERRNSCKNSKNQAQ